jgi:hypothetical protein
MSNHQQTSVGIDARDRVECLCSVKATCQRRVYSQQLALMWIPALRSQLGRFVGAYLGAENHLLKAAVQLLDGDAGGARLRTPTVRQTAGGVRARAMRLSLRVTK